MKSRGWRDGNVHSGFLLIVATTAMLRIRIHGKWKRKDKFLNVVSSREALSPPKRERVHQRVLQRPTRPILAKSWSSLDTSIFRHAQSCKRALQSGLSPRQIDFG